MSIDIMNLYLKALFVCRNFLVIMCSVVNYYYYGEGNDNGR